LKVSPSAILMAPDGLTAYLLDNAGGITYYDILSGTADLSLSTFTPGLAGGYGPGNQVFIHPDGTRLFWNNGLSLVTFDLTLHKITQIFPSGLPPGTTASLRMSQEGSTVRFVNANGSTAVVDTRYGVVLETLQAQPGSITYPGPAN
jgi:hypothetical protein